MISEHLERKKQYLTGNDATLDNYVTLLATTLQLVFIKLQLASRAVLPFFTAPSPKKGKTMAGRKRKLTDKLAEKILDLIADGLTIRQIFEREDINYTWTSFRKELVSNSNLMDRYQKSKELAIDLELSNLKDKRLELEAKIESGEIDGKAGQNLVNLYKIIVASSQ